MLAQDSSAGLEAVSISAKMQPVRPIVRPAHQDENAEACPPDAGNRLGQGAAIVRRHGAVIEGKVQIGDGALQFAANPWIAIPLRQSRNLGGEHRARGQLDRAGRRVPRVPDPDDAVARCDCDGRSRARQRRARRTCEAVSFMCVEHERISPEENGRRAGRAVGGANFVQHCGDGVGREIHAAILSPAGASEGLGRRRIGLGAFAAPDHGDRLFDAGNRRAGCLAPIKARLRRGPHVEFAPRPNRTAVQFTRRLDQRDAPSPPSLEDGPVERRRAAIAARAGMHDQAKRARQHVRGNGPFEKRGDDEVGLEQIDGFAGVCVVDVELDRNAVTALTQFDMKSLRQAVERMADEQDFH